jgi:hypothetical protein
MKSSAFVCMLAYGLAGCTQEIESSCSQPKTVVLGATPSLEQLEESVYSCIHSQARYLAAAPGGTEQIADSVLYGCYGRISNWRTTVEKFSGEYAVAAAGNAYFEPMISDFRKSAVYRVTEARAGKCNEQ